MNLFGCLPFRHFSRKSVPKKSAELGLSQHDRFLNARKLESTHSAQPFCPERQDNIDAAAKIYRGLAGEGNIDGIYHYYRAKAEGIGDDFKLTNNVLKPIKECRAELMRQEPNALFNLASHCHYGVQNILYPDLDNAVFCYMLAADKKQQDNNELSLFVDQFVEECAKEIHDIATWKKCDVPDLDAYQKTKQFLSKEAISSIDKAVVGMLAGQQCLVLRKHGQLN